MNTPITDAAANDSIVKVYETSKRLETDRAALMEALERATTDFQGSTTGYFHVEPSDVAFAKAALTAARANFPQP